MGKANAKKGPKKSTKIKIDGTDELGRSKSDIDSDANRDLGDPKEL